jgi:hypothetical protein
MAVKTYCDCCDKKDICGLIYNCDDCLENLYFCSFQCLCSYECYYTCNICWENILTCEDCQNNRNENYTNNGYCTKCSKEQFATNLRNKIL